MAKILVIDDEEPARESIAALLEQHGHEVTLADNGHDGFRLQVADPAEVVICDIVMPRNEGTETIIQLRRQMPSVRIIAISGARNKDLYLRTVKLLGADRVLVKPFGNHLLLHAVNELLDKKPATGGTADSVDLKTPPFLSS
jgi:two-component system, chemotaxis family, chemotaxis protein CheY